MKLAATDVRSHARVVLLAGYRSEQPEERLTDPMAELMDMVVKFNESQLKMMSLFTHFLAKVVKEREQL